MWVITSTMGGAGINPNREVEVPPPPSRVINYTSFKREKSQHVRTINTLQKFPRRENQPNGGKSYAPHPLSKSLHPPPPRNKPTCIIIIIYVRL
jgi:hypothetical protein